jgi:phosphohistidine phosphatase
MKLYLMRHGLAIERGIYLEDGDRPLTDLGKKKTAQVSQHLQKLELRFELIVTSPLVRAQQTAEILHHQSLSRDLEISPHLAPEGDLSRFLTELVSYAKPEASLIAVGHQPDLGNWAEMLIYGQVREVIVLKKAGIIGLQLPDPGEAIANSQLFWLTSPKLLW